MKKKKKKKKKINLIKKRYGKRLMKILEKKNYRWYFRKKNH